ncbi:MAG: DUF551 domain-containing protein [Lachnospiraceae bacterium]|nr:DUF551 domain-containing protein [Lachnospiraceae bacterium]
MIDKKKLIDELKESGMIVDNEYGNAMVDFIESQPKIGEWIPCSERHPEEHDVYMVAWKPKTGLEQKECYYEIVECEDGQWIGDIPQSEPFGGYDVFAWQPLPEPYKEG